MEKFKEPIKALKRELRSVVTALEKVADRYRHIMTLVVAVAPSTTKVDLLKEVEDILARFKPGYRKQVRAFLTGTLQLARDGILTPDTLEKYSEEIGALDSNELFRLVRSLKKAPIEEALKIAADKKRVGGSKGRDKAPKGKNEGVDHTPFEGYDASIADIRAMDSRELEELRLQLKEKLKGLEDKLLQAPSERLATISQIIQELEAALK